MTKKAKERGPEVLSADLATEKPTKGTRPVQPRCASDTNGRVCNHPQSFHGTAKGACRALGCHCKRWKAPKH